MKVECCDSGKKKNATVETILMVAVLLALLFFLGIFKGVHSRPTGRGDYDVVRHLVDGQEQFSLVRHEQRYAELNLVEAADLTTHRDAIIIRRQDGSLWQYGLDTHGVSPYAGDPAQLRLRPIREVWDSL